MPKRRNPFGECSPLQLKQHVGIKEIDMGVNHEHNMKSVFDRTRDLLFNGAKKPLSAPMDANCNNIYPEDMLQMHTDETMEAEQSLVENQMHISNTGQLTVSNKPSETKPANAFQLLMKNRSGKTNSSCQCCKGVAASQNRCGFCEKSICHDCVRVCGSCDGLFCQLCSVMNPEVEFPQWFCQQCSYSYEDITERSFCLSCAS